MKRVRVSLQAKRDLDNIWHFVATDASSMDVADRVTNSIVAHFALLAKQPRSGRIREDIDPGVRSFRSGSYLIYYRESRSNLMISRILHCRRDQSSAWRKSETT